MLNVEIVFDHARVIERPVRRPIRALFRITRKFLEPWHGGILIAFLAPPEPDEAVLLSHRIRLHFERSGDAIFRAVTGNANAFPLRRVAEAVVAAGDRTVDDSTDAQRNAAMCAPIVHADRLTVLVAPQHEAFSHANQ